MNRMNAVDRGSAAGNGWASPSISSNASCSSTSTSLIYQHIVAPYIFCADELRVVVQLDAVRELEGQEDRMAHLATNVPRSEIVVETREVRVDLDFFDPVVAGLTLVKRGAENFYGEVLPSGSVELVLPMGCYSREYLANGGVASQSAGVHSERRRQFRGYEVQFIRVLKTALENTEEEVEGLTLCDVSWEDTSW